MMRLVRVGVGAVIALVLAAAAVRALSSWVERERASIADQWRAALEAQQDTVARLRRLLDVAERDRLSLVERLAGWERRETPRPGIVRVDTVIVTKTDTVLVAVEIDRSGTLDRLATDSSRTALLIPQEDVSRCDLGLRITATSLDCREPRLGHFWLFGSAGLSYRADGSAIPTVGAGLLYRPSFRSPWSVRAEWDAASGRGRFLVERSIRASF